MLCFQYLVCLIWQCIGQACPVFLCTCACMWVTSEKRGPYVGSMKFNTHNWNLSVYIQLYVYLYLHIFLCIICNKNIWIIIWEIYRKCYLQPRLHIGNHWQRYFNPVKELPLKIRINDRVTWECGRVGKFSFIVCQEAGGIASPFHPTIAKERIVGNMLPVSYRLDESHIGQ
jgi:hypothetical protein